MDDGVDFQSLLRTLPPDPNLILDEFFLHETPLNETLPDETHIPDQRDDYFQPIQCGHQCFGSAMQTQIDELSKSIQIVQER
jgi:hypothetical protein